MSGKKRGGPTGCPPPEASVGIFLRLRYGSVLHVLHLNAANGNASIGPGDVGIGADAVA